MITNYEMMVKLYQIRWVLDYTDKPSAYGLWDSAEKKCFLQNRNGFIKARVQAKDAFGKIKTVIECSKDEFITCHWHMIAEDVLGKANKGKINSIIYGIMIYTPTKKISFFMNGEMKIEENKEKVEYFLPSIEVSK